MGFFKRRKVEEVNIVIKPPRTKVPDANVLMYSERIEFVAPTEYVQTNNVDERLAVINKEFEAIQLKSDELLQAYYNCKIFSRIANRDRDFNSKILMIDKYVNRIRHDEQELTRTFNNLKKQDFTIDSLDDFYVQLENFAQLQKELSRKISLIQTRYYNHFKIATANVTLNKTSKELEIMNRNLNLFLDDFKTLSEAAEFVFFNSGQLFFSLVNSLVNCFRDFQKEEYIKQFDFKYFLKSDVIITLTLKEWIDLFNKIKFVMKATTDADLGNYLEFKNNYIQFELRYSILMMNMEGRKNSNIENFSI